MNSIQTTSALIVLLLATWSFTTVSATTEAPTPEAPTPVAKTTGVVFKLNNNCGSKQAVEVNGKAFQIPKGSSRRFDYPVGTKVYKLDNGARGALLYTIGSKHAGKVLAICP